MLCEKWLQINNFKETEPAKALKTAWSFPCQFSFLTISEPMLVVPMQLQLTVCEQCDLLTLLIFPSGNLNKPKIFSSWLMKLSLITTAVQSWCLPPA